MEDARILGHGQPPGRDQSAQYLPRIEQWPRAILEIGVAIGGIIVPIAAAFLPRIRSNRLSLFLPPAALLPTAVIAMLFKFTGILSQKGYIPELVHRPSEAVELYLYYFVLAYLLIFTRRIAELETKEDADRIIRSSLTAPHTTAEQL